MSSDKKDIKDEETLDDVEPKKIKTSLNLEDLGAGYDANDKRVHRAIAFYEEKLLPFIKENHEIFKSSNFLSLKGYGTDLTKDSSKHRLSPEEDSRSQEGYHHSKKSRR